jgi:hypothetical protein
LGECLRSLKTCDCRRLGWSTLGDFFFHDAFGTLAGTEATSPGVLQGVSCSAYISFHSFALFGGEPFHSPSQEEMIAALSALAKRDVA